MARAYRLIKGNRYVCFPFTQNGLDEAKALRKKSGYWSYARIDDILDLGPRGNRDHTLELYTEYSTCGTNYGKSRVNL